MKRIIFSVICLLIGCTALFARSTGTKDTATVYAALPVKETYVPNDVVEKLKSQYGPQLYNITCVKGKDGYIEYWVGIIKNGKLEEEQTKETTLENK